jgi:hypothetical protein
VCVSTIKMLPFDINGRDGGSWDHRTKNNRKGNKFIFFCVHAFEDPFLKCKHACTTVVSFLQGSSSLDYKGKEQLAV